MKYDVIIVGAGPSGIFCAYELKKQNKDLKVLMIEKGRSIDKRMCPKRKTLKCVTIAPSGPGTQTAHCPKEYSSFWTSFLSAILPTRLPTV